MKPIEQHEAGKRSETSLEMRDARPLIQAIFLGLILAVALTVAAAMANQDLPIKTKESEAAAQLETP
ncbi:MAG: hypothetical protein ABJL55_23495 [Roseibium sp.]